MKRCRRIQKVALGALLIIGVTVFIASCSSGLSFGRVSLDIQGTKPLSGESLNIVGKIITEALDDAVDSVTLCVINSTSAEIGTLNLTKAQISLKEIKLIMGDANEEGEQEHEEGEQVNEEVEEENETVDFEGPYIVDLIADTVSPSPGDAEIPVGVYNQIEGMLNTDNGISGNSSIYLEGTYTGETGSGPVTNMPFYLSFALDDNFQLTGAGDDAVGFTVDGVEDQIIIAFRLNKWFRFDDLQTNSENVNFSDVVPAGGKIQLIINSGDTDPICEVIVSNIQSSGDFGEDINGDGELGSDEDSDSPVEDELDE
jgi:hypothetical protein